MVDPPCASWRIHHGTRFCLGRGPRPLVGSGPVPKPKVKRGDDGSVRGRIVRLRRLVEALHGAPRGMSNAQLMRRTGGSRLRAVEGHLYLVAFDVSKRGARTFKLPRMRDVVVLAEAAESHPEVDEEALFADSVKAWAGPSHDVVIKIPARLAGVAAEWPLIAGQEVHDQGDGSALVRARVAGLIEAMRWVLRWGADAEVVAPAELRERVADELRRALTAYR